MSLAGAASCLAQEASVGACLRRVAYLQPGQVFASAAPATVTTVLGSCVAVCLRDPIAGVGGMNHFVLPEPLAAGPSSPRFAETAMRRLVAALEALGARARFLEAKVFGGAAVLQSARDGEQLGARNVAAAFRLLEAARIRVVAEDVGGTRGRKLLFHTDEGTAFVRVL